MTARRLFVWLHRYVGLVMAGFLIMVGLTGSLLAFNVELERIFAPQLFAKPHPGEPRFDLATLAERAEALLPQAQVFAINMNEPDQAYVVFMPRDDPRTGQPYDLGFTEVFLDPWTGEELGARNRADLSEGVVNLMPFVYLLHYQLVLGELGMWIVGFVAIGWTIDCFVGFYLTLPHTTNDFFRRWKPAWTIKRGAGLLRLNFDIHRSFGLWLWPSLFVFAWSSVMFNMRETYQWPMRRIFDYGETTQSRSPPGQRNLDWRAGLARGLALMREQAELQGFTFGDGHNLSYDPFDNVYEYEARGSRDVFERSPKGGGTVVRFSGETGALIELSTPTGQHLGNSVDAWLGALHMARVFGRPYQIFVSALGLVVAALSVTGVYIWWKKRAARIFRAARSGLRATARALQT
ncbi:MAG TPA: PepSY-associated TM helix domain-containing protein [Methylocystis sp.]|nr:PepSY-associated TM helix domain-containing protein [Methylocystis sp.]